MRLHTFHVVGRLVSVRKGRDDAKGAERYDRAMVDIGDDMTPSKVVAFVYANERFPFPSDAQVGDTLAISFRIGRVFRAKGRGIVKPDDYVRLNAGATRVIVSARAEEEKRKRKEEEEWNEFFNEVKAGCRNHVK